MVKKIVILILLVFVTGSLNKIYCQLLKNTYVVGSIGIVQRYCDIGTPTPLESFSSLSQAGIGFNSGIRIIKMFDFRLNTGIGYHFSSVTNEDGGALADRGYRANSNIHEIEAILNYDLLVFIDGKNRLFKIIVGGVVSYYYSFNNMNEPFYSDTRSLKEPTSGIIIYPNLAFSYDLDKFILGLNLMLGQANNDYLEGLGNALSSQNDGIGIINISVGYKLK